MSNPDFDTFERHQVTVHSEVVGDLSIACRKSGTGPPLLLLHGYPQTAHIWHKIAGRLSLHFTVVASDLRGYGESSKPPGSDSHVEYSKREMAADQVQVMKHFGFDKFKIVSHDRGARVAHRLALDYPASVEQLMVLDILPTLYLYDHTNMQFAEGYWHWFFLIQPAPGPENVISADTDRFWQMLGGRKSHQNVIWFDSDIELYKAAAYKPDAIHASCEDYRAAASIDLQHDRKDLEAGNKLGINKLHVYWGRKGMMNNFENPVEVWKGYCKQTVEVDGSSLDCGHYIAEEKPEELLEEILRCFAQ